MSDEINANSVNQPLITVMSQQHYPNQFLVNLHKLLMLICINFHIFKVFHYALSEIEIEVRKFKVQRSMMCLIMILL